MKVIAQKKKKVTRKQTSLTFQFWWEIAWDNDSATNATEEVDFAFFTKSNKNALETVVLSKFCIRAATSWAPIPVPNAGNELGSEVKPLMGFEFEGAGSFELFQTKIIRIVK